MRPMFSTALFLLATLSMATPAFAEKTTNTDAQAILAQQQEIRAEATSKKGRYRDMNEANRKQLLDQQDRVQKLLAGVSDTTQLGEHDQIALFNSLEAIEALVNKAEDERLICERRRPSGSNRTQTVCRSVAERRADQQHAEESLRRNQTCPNCSR